MSVCPPDMTRMPPALAKEGHPRVSINGQNARVNPTTPTVEHWPDPGNRRKAWVGQNLVRRTWRTACHPSPPWRRAPEVRSNVGTGTLGSRSFSGRFPGFPASSLLTVGFGAGPGLIVPPDVCSARTRPMQQDGPPRPCLVATAPLHPTRVSCQDILFCRLPLVMSPHW